MKQSILKIAFTVLSVIFFYGCSLEPYDWSQDIKLEIITGECLETTYNYAKVNIEIVDPTEKPRIGGVCYSENENPSIENNDPYIQYDVLLGKQDIEIYGLTQNTKYYYRAFIFDDSFTNITYGDIKSFTTPNIEYITDGLREIDNVVYKFRPGGKVWYSYNRFENISSVTIPEKITYKGVEYKVTGVNDMQGLTNLNSIYFPNTIDTIADDAFYSCTSLKTINIPSSVKYIGNAFTNTPWKNSIKGFKYINNILFYYGSETASTDDIVVNDGTILISPSAFFKYRDYKQLTFPSSLQEIGASAFVVASKLTKITFKGTTPPKVKIEDEVFDNFSSTNKETCILEVPMSSIDTYKKDSFWGQFKTINGYDN